jgi:hypothetical protein
MRDEIVVGLDDSLSSKAALDGRLSRPGASVPCCEPCMCLTGRPGSAPPVFRAGEPYGCEPR